LLQDSSFIDDETETINVKVLASLYPHPPYANKTCNLGDTVMEVISIKNNGSVIAEDVQIDKNGSIAEWIVLNASLIGEIGQNKVVRIKVYIDIPKSGISWGKYDGSLIIKGTNLDPIPIPITIEILPEDIITPLLPSLILAVGGIISAFLQKVSFLHFIRQIRLPSLIKAFL